MHFHSFSVLIKANPNFAQTQELCFFFFFVRSIVCTSVVCYHANFTIPHSKANQIKPGFSMPQRQAKAEKNHMKSDPISECINNAQFVQEMLA